MWGCVGSVACCPWRRQPGLQQDGVQEIGGVCVCVECVCVCVRERERERADEMSRVWTCAAKWSDTRKQETWVPHHCFNSHLKWL